MRRGGRSPVVLGGAAFDPLATPDLVGLWMAEDATDNGTTLTVPNRVSGGAATTSTGAGRPTIAATGLEGVAPGIDFGSATAAMTAAIGAAVGGATELTVLMLAQDTTTTAGYLWTYWGAVQTSSALYNSAAGRHTTTTRVTSGGSRAVRTRGRDLVFARAAAYRADIGATSGEDALALDGAAQVVVSATGPADTTGSFSSGTLYIGSTQVPSAFFKGRIGAWAVVRRRLSDEEVTQWTAWLQSQIAPRIFNVMWEGDSIQANSNATYAQWRKVLWDLYAADSGTPRFFRPVGPLSPAVPTWTQDFCLCAGGTTIVDHEGFLATYEVGTRYVPDIVPVCLGTVDAATVDAATMDSRMSSFLDELATRLPSALIVLQKIVPRATGDAAETRVADWNDNYYAPLLAAKQGAGMNIIGDTTLYDLAPYTYTDGLHPDSAMATPMGTAMYAALRGWAGV